MFDLGPAAHQLPPLVRGVREDQLDAPTPCDGWTVGDLVAHLNQFATVFAHNARRETPPSTGDLPDGWRSVVPQRVDELVEAWRDESAWTGRMSAGGVEMAAEDNAVVAVEELVLHAWDLARATGQDFHVDDAWLDTVDRFFEVFAEPLASGQGPHGPQVAVPDDAPRFERILGRAGRDPGWSATRGRPSRRTTSW